VKASAVRVAVVGNGGGGKSTLARRVAASRGLSYHSVDQVQWLPEWEPAPTAVVARRLADWVATPRWVIDGWGPWDAIEHRLLVADAVIFVDLPRWQHFWLASERLVAAASGVPRADPVEGCDDLDARRRLFETLDYVDRELLPALRHLVDSLPASTEVLRIGDANDLQTVE
jgi:adenylate kinase family enzyme